MHRIPLDGRLSVLSQPGIADIGALARQGYASLINLRPDGEEPGQPGDAAERAAAAAAGLDYAFVPVVADAITRADVRAFQRAIGGARGPVAAHCRTGKRALMLHVLGEMLDGRMASEQVPAFGQAHGVDLAGVVQWLQREQARVPVVEGFFEPRTGSVQYIVTDPATRACAIIDPVLDFDEKSAGTATTSADALLAYVRAQGLQVQWLLETHPHADHLSAAGYLKARTGARTAIGAQVREVQRIWRDIYHLPQLATDGSQWDRLFEDGEQFRIGTLQARVLHSPGHTAASVSYLIGDAAFVHDTLFMPDGGTARADFPGGDARALWRSIDAILALPDETRLFTGHDYQPGGRHPRWESTVSEQRRANGHVAGRDEADFVALRQARDRGLPMPRLLLPSLQVNIQGGTLPAPEANGMRYLKLPLDAFPEAAW